jgi:hypothetical protein
MTMEKSSCLQLTREEYELAKSMLKGNAGELIKFSGLVSRLDVTSEELEMILDKGEYRIVED